MPNNPNAAANLKPFTGADDPRRVTGSINKGKQHSSTRLKRLLYLTENLKNPVTGELEGFTVLEQLDLQQIIKARQGDTRSYNSLLDRLEGKPRETVAFEGEIKHNVVYLPRKLKLDSPPQTDRSTPEK